MKGCDFIKVKKLLQILVSNNCISVWILRDKNKVILGNNVKKEDLCIYSDFTICSMKIENDNIILTIK